MFFGIARYAGSFVPRAGGKEAALFVITAQVRLNFEVSKGCRRLKAYRRPVPAREREGECVRVTRNKDAL